jgi:hypothetical protein
VRQGGDLVCTELQGFELGEARAKLVRDRTFYPVLGHNKHLEIGQATEFQGDLDELVV